MKAIKECYLLWT